MFPNQTNTIIVDDEPNAAQLLQSLLENFSVFGKIEFITNSISAFNSIIELQPQFLFLDVQMPEISGLQLAEKVKPHLPDTKVIFVTAYDQYALDALRQNVFDYLLKPVVKSDLVRIVEKLLNYNLSKAPAIKTEHLVVHGLKGIYHRSLDEIVYFEAEGAYTNIVLSSGKQILSTHNIGKIIPELPQGRFFRISRKHVVNKNYFTFFNSRDKILKLETSEREFSLEVTLKVSELKQLLGT